MLVDVLNRLAAVRSGPELFQELQQTINALSPNERREAAILHLSALLEELPSSALGDEVRFPSFSVRLLESDAKDCSIAYEDLDQGFKVIGIDLARSDGPPRLSGLLDLLLEARGHSDILLYLPADMRTGRIQEIARRVGASERFVRFILARAPAIERAIAA